MTRYGVTVQPIALQFGQVTGFSPAAGGGGGGGGAVVLLPLLAALLGPIVAAGPSQAPVAAPGPGPAAVTPVLTAPAGPGAPATVTPPPVTAAAPPSAGAPRKPVVLPQGPTRTVVARRAPTGRRPPLPFTGEDLWHPILAGLELIGVGAVLRCGLWRLDRDRRRLLG
jgi:hypothetical protein